MSDYIRSWFSKLDPSSKVMVAGMSFLLLLSVAIFSVFTATGGHLDPGWDERVRYEPVDADAETSLETDVVTLPIVDAGELLHD